MGLRDKTFKISQRNKPPEKSLKGQERFIFQNGN